MTNDEARRRYLQDHVPQGGTHAGLWLDRYLTIQTHGESGSADAQRAKTELIQQVTSIIRVPEGYRDAYARRAKSLGAPSLGRKSCALIFRAQGRLAVGLGQSGVLENGLSLDHTWGVPILPGSSLKGVAAAAAHKLTEDEAWRKETAHTSLGESAAYLFGTNDQRGVVDFLDAWWLPDSDSALHLDIVTAHNSSYYQRNDAQAAPPQGMDSPVPVSFISSAGRFLVILEANAAEADDGWLDAAMDLLKLGLERLGIGAKTNAGYGHMIQDETATAELHQQLEREAKL